MKRTALDAVELGFETVLLTDATRGIDAKKDDVEKAVEEMESKGARLVTLESFRK